MELHKQFQKALQSPSDEFVFSLSSNWFLQYHGSAVSVIIEEAWPWPMPCYTAAAGVKFTLTSATEAGPVVLFPLYQQDYTRDKHISNLIQIAEDITSNLLDKSTLKLHTSCFDNSSV